MEPQEQGPRNTIQFFTMMISSLIKGIPQMIKSMIAMSVISGAITLGFHFYLILVPNDGYNTSGIVWLDSILVLANVRPTPPNVLLFWFLANYIFWMVIGTFKEYGLVGGVKQFVTTPIFAVSSLRESGFGAFPMIMGGLGFAFLLRLGILGTMTTLQMFLMMIGILVSQENSITLIGMDLFFTDIRKLVNRGVEIESSGFAMPTSLILGSVLGFAYLVFFPYNALMVQVLLVLMVLGIGGMLVQGRKKGKADNIALALMLVCALSLMAIPVGADDGGAAESYGAMNVINNAPLRNFMIKQGIAPAIAGIAASIAASGKMTPKIFDQLKKGKIKVTSDMSIQEMQTMQKIRTKVLTNLQRIEREVLFGKANKLWKADGEKGNILEHTRELINGILENGEVDINHLDKVHTVYTHHVTGRTITEDMIPSDAQLNAEILSDTLKWSGEALIRGRDQDGTISWIGMGSRIALGIGTGGTSEFFYAPAGALYTMKDYVDAGETNGYVIFAKTVAWTAFEEMVIGNSIQYGVGKIGSVAGEFGEYMAKEFPDMAGKMKNLINKTDDILHKDITDLWPSNGKPGLPRGSQTKSAKELVDDMIEFKRSGGKQPGLDDFKVGQKGPSGEVEYDFSKMKPIEGDPPQLPYRDAKGIKEAADMNNAVTIARNTNPDSIDLINNKMVNPKSMDIKAKSANAEDVLLGFDDSVHFQGRDAGNKGLVMCKKPKLPDNFDNLPTNQQTKVMDRYWKRLDEFDRLKPELETMAKDGKIDWDPDTGIITNPRNGKPYGGDNDLLGHLDADTGQPLNPYRNNTINNQLQTNGHTVHNDQGGWQYGQLEGSNPSKFNQYKNIDEGILNGHKSGDLVAYDPKTGKWYEVSYEGSTTRNYAPTTGGTN